MQRFRVTRKSIAIFGAVSILAVVAGAAIQQIDDYRGGDLPSLDMLQKNFQRIRAANDQRLEEIVGKAPLENGGWQVYYYVKDAQGNVFVDDKIALIKLDSDVWIMRIRGANQGAEQWGIVTKY